MKESDIYPGIVIMVLGLILFGLTFGVHEDVVPGDTLGSRFFPRLVVGLLLLCSITLIRNGLTARKTKSSDSLEKRRQLGERTFSRAVWTISLSFLYVALFNLLGIIVITPLFIFGMLLVWGEISKVNLIAIPIISTAFIYFIFSYAFEIMLPMGIFE